MRNRAVFLAALLLAGCGSGGGSSGSARSSIAASTSQTSPAPVSPQTTPPVPTLYAGAASVDLAPPPGTPLAGVGIGPRRVFPPVLSPSSLNTFLAASTGTRDPVRARALVLTDGSSHVALVAVDAIGTTAEIVSAVTLRLQASGSKVQPGDLMIFASHTHSGPGALTDMPFWAFLAVDLKKSRVFDPLADAVARCVVQAESALQPCVVGAATAIVASATHNRRAGVSLDFRADSVDPELIALRVDDTKGAPIATLFDFAIHGTCLDQTNLLLSADVAGEAAREIEAGGGGVALFANAPEGDVDPSGTGSAGLTALGAKIAQAALQARASAKTAVLPLATTHETVDLGNPFIRVDPSRFKGSSGGFNNLGPLLSITSALQAVGLGGVGFDVPLPDGWVERSFRFQGIRLGTIGLTSFPGEPIHTIGLDAKARGKALGFDCVIPIALANGHASYVTTAKEYGYGGYEAVMTMFGPQTGDMLLTNAVSQLAKIKP